MKDECCKSLKCFVTECSCLQKPGLFLGSILLFILRLYIGWQFFLAGKGKLMDAGRIAGFFESLGIPFPLLSAYIAGSIECFGGLLLLIGLASRLVSIPLAAVMTVAYFTAHVDAVKNIFNDPTTFIHQDPFLFLLTALLVISFGPGYISIDWWLKKRCCSESSGSMGSSCCS